MAIASEAVPAVFVNEIFSFAAVAFRVNTISVAPSLPNFNVLPSARLGAITILPAEASIETASSPVPDELSKRLESFPPVTAIVKSSPSEVEAREKFDGAPIASMLIAPPSAVSIAIPPVPASISIPPSVLEALITTAVAASRSELSSIFLATLKSIPSAPLTVTICFPVTVFVSSPPIVSVLSTPTSRVLFLSTLISIPPADAVSSRALAVEVPVEERMREESVAPVRETVKS